MVYDNPAPQIGIVDPQFRAQTLELVYRDMPAYERRRHIAEIEANVSPPGIAPFDGLLGAWRKGRLVGAMFSQITPGKTAVLQLPRLVQREPPSTASRLFSATWKLLSQRQIAFAQVLLSLVGREEVAMLHLGGFHYLANLLYLVSASNIKPRPVVAPRIAPRIATTGRGLLFEPYRASCRAQWTKMIAAIHKEPLDCAGLEDPRSPDDVLAGYRSTGAFDPDLWLIARHERQAVGCLLLADHPRYDAMELLYLGLIPEVRGRGWGKQLARHAQWLAHRAGRRRLLAAVDSANTPAIQTYTAMDFQTWQRRRLYIKRFPRVAIGTRGPNRFSTMAAETG